MRISDWSSDVCSSDLLDDQVGAQLALDVDRPFRGQEQRLAVEVGPERGALLRDLDERRLARAFPSRIPPSLDLVGDRSEEHTSELQSLMRISYAVFCLKKKIKNRQNT